MIDLLKERPIEEILKFGVLDNDDFSIDKGPHIFIDFYRRMYYEQASRKYEGRGILSDNSSDPLRFAGKLEFIRVDKTTLDGILARYRGQ